MPSRTRQERASSSARSRSSVRHVALVAEGVVVVGQPGTEGRLRLCRGGRSSGHRLRCRPAASRGAKRPPPSALHHRPAPPSAPPAIRTAPHRRDQRFVIGCPVEPIPPAPPRPPGTTIHVTSTSAKALVCTLEAVSRTVVTIRHDLCGGEEAEARPAGFPAGRPAVSPAGLPVESPAERPSRPSRPGSAETCPPSPPSSSPLLPSVPPGSPSSVTAPSPW